MSPIVRAASPAARKASARQDQVGSEQPLLAELEQQWRPRGHLALGDQAERAVKLCGSLLVVVSLGDRECRRLIGGDRTLGARDGDREAVVAGELGRLGLGILLQGLGDREVKPRAACLVAARDERFADQRVREGDRRARGGDLVDQALCEGLCHRALRVLLAESGGARGE